MCDVACRDNSIVQMLSRFRQDLICNPSNVAVLLRGVISLKSALSTDARHRDVHST